MTTAGRGDGATRQDGDDQPSVAASPRRRVAVSPEGRLPGHVAIIMDGNGRWARQRGLPRVEGHRRGVQSVRATVEECCRLGIGELTLYCLSSENLKGPQAELDFLIALLEQYLVHDRMEIMEQHIP